MSLGREIRTGFGCRLALAALLAALGTALSPASPLAGASTGDIIAPQHEPHTPADGWQAGTCITDAPQCTADTPDQFFRDAAGHPQKGFTQFIVKNEPGLVGPEEPIGGLKTVRVDLPRGLSVNPQATEQCTPAEFADDPAANCPDAAVGTSFVTGSALGVPSPVPISATVYNIDPPAGEPARFGFDLLGNEIFLRADVAWDGDYHEGFTIDVPPAPLIEALILKNRLVFDGRSGDGTFITTPTTCFDPESPGFEGIYSTWLLASSISEEASPNYEFPRDARPPLESPLPEGEKPIDCENVPYDPTLDFDPGVAATDSPAGAATQVEVPHLLGGTERESSQTRRAELTLPPGMGLNPSAANGLLACTDAELGKGTRAPVACPAASRVGGVTIETPPLPPGSLQGDVYVGRQLSRDPASGDAYRIFVVAESARYDISARLIGRVRADPATGRLTATFDDPSIDGLPQVPFSSFRLDFDDGPRAPLTSPSTCGPHTAAADLTPWSGNAAAHRADDFTIANAPGGAPCPASLGARPFAPRLGLALPNPRGGAYSPFTISFSREDGEQELKGATVDLPRGLSARLAGVPYCAEGAIAAAGASSGAEEAAAPRCPLASLIGSATVLSGSGPAPLRIGGRVFLAGPYDGAPLSLAIVTPATAGPFDLGSVVARVALFVDRRTARVRAVSDPLPHVFGGARLDLRSVTVSLSRPRFSLNPTNCSPMAVATTIAGGGSDPLDPAAFSAVPVGAPFQVGGCERLGFKPKLFLRLFGAKRRAKNPKLRAVVAARGGDANVGRAAVILPKALILDQSNIAKVCTRVQYAAGACPRNSIYGYARAFSPLLDRPLSGPVFLRSSDNVLPDLVASLRGQLEIDLVGRTDSVRGRIRNVFDVVPDVPVSKFVLTLRGGRRGILTNSRSLCGRKAGKKIRAIAKFKGQNAKRVKMRPKVRRPCKGKKRPRKRLAHRRGAGHA